MSIRNIPPSRKDTGKSKGKEVLAPRTPAKHISTAKTSTAMNSPLTVAYFVTDTILQIASTPQSSSTYQQALMQPDYVTKPQVSFVCPIEIDNYRNQIPDTIKTIFPPHPTEELWNFIPEDLKKDRRYYELILIDTNSAAICHKVDSKGKTYSQIKIINVLTHQQWGQGPYTAKKFSVPYHNLQFNYIDYKKAWHNVLFYKNYSHSWFIYFDKEIAKNNHNGFPNWFIEWFHTYGPVKQILPPPVLEGFEVFKQKMTDYPEEEKPFQFFFRFRIPWVLSWVFTVTKGSHSCPYISYLARRYRVKWWPNYNTEYADKTRVLNWIGFYHSTTTAKRDVHTEASFLTEKSKLMAELAAISTQEEFAKKLEEIYPTVASSSDHNSQASQGNDNEDDCFGLDYLEAESEFQP